MTLSKAQLWHRFRQHYTEFPSLELSLDISRVSFPDPFLVGMEASMQKAFATMQALESGAIANPDEKRMVGHYWLRHPSLAPAKGSQPHITEDVRAEIERTLAEVKSFAAAVHQGAVTGSAGAFRNVLIIGIGGSALGPQFVARALGRPGADKLRAYFFDNTDPDGMEKTLAEIRASTGGNGGTALGQTLCVVISKSGGTPETRNGMLVAKAAYERAELDFAKHAVAVTGVGSALHKFATDAGWVRSFPMWDWVGGRTSETSAVGLLPAALQGLDIDGFLAGAKACDEVTRVADTRRNPAAQLALMWHFLTEGRGAKDMVVLPYKDRLELFAKYLQQLVMESLGKELDLSGRVVNQGIAVYGNKGSTDQHAYVQQLREGVPNFFAVFIEVLKDGNGPEIEVEPAVTSGDYLSGFLLGTREALYEKGRQSITITIREVSAFSVGVLIALFERAVGFYASLVNINAYHQPGVEAGKKAAAIVLALQARAVAHLTGNRQRSFTAEDLAVAIGQPEAAEIIFKTLTHLAVNGRGVKTPRGSGAGMQFEAG